MFSIPTSLPPSRYCNHKIELIPNAQPMKVKPYRYLHIQKIDIKLQEHKMLTEGLIEHSTSPFSSPVLLVKKKDGT